MGPRASPLEHDPAQDGSVGADAYLDADTVAALAMRRVAQGRERLGAGTSLDSDEALIDGELRVVLDRVGRIPAHSGLSDALHTECTRSNVPTITPYAHRHTSAMYVVS